MRTRRRGRWVSRFVLLVVGFAAVSCSRVEEKLVGIACRDDGGGWGSCKAHGAAVADGGSVWLFKLSNRSRVYPTTVVEEIEKHFVAVGVPEVVAEEWAPEAVEFLGKSATSRAALVGILVSTATLGYFVLRTPDEETLPHLPDRVQPVEMVLLDEEHQPLNQAVTRALIGIPRHVAASDATSDAER